MAKISETTPVSWLYSPKAFVFALATIEAFVTIASGFLARGYSDPRVGGALSFCIWFAGGLITLNSITFQLRLDAAIQRELSAVIGHEIDHVRRVLGIFNAYHSVNHQDLKKYRDDALRVALHKLEALTRGEAEVEGDEYYLWLNDKIKQTKIVRAVSCRPLRVYIEDNREKNWAHANEKAAVGGRQVMRIFILEPSELLAPEARALLRGFVLDSRVDAYIVWRENVQKGIRSRLQGGGFSIYDDDVVFYDRSYFETDVGLHDGHSLAPTRPMMPRASIYCKPHPMFHEYESIFKGLEDQIRYRPVAAAAGTRQRELEIRTHACRDLASSCGPDRIPQQP